MRPLGLYYWGKVWTLVAWCELREDFRAFRVDRIAPPRLEAAFKPEAGKALRDYLRRVAGQVRIPSSSIKSRG